MKKITSVMVTVFVFLTSFIGGVFAETKAVDMLNKKSNSKEALSAKEKNPARPNYRKLDNLEKAAKKPGNMLLHKGNNLEAKTPDSSKFKLNNLEGKR